MGYDGNKVLIRFLLQHTTTSNVYGSIIKKEAMLDLGLRNTFDMMDDIMGRENLGGSKCCFIRSNVETEMKIKGGKLKSLIFSESGLC